VVVAFEEEFRCNVSRPPLARIIDIIARAVARRSDRGGRGSCSSNKQQQQISQTTC